MYFWLISRREKIWTIWCRSHSDTINHKWLIHIWLTLPKNDELENGTVPSSRCFVLFIWNHHNIHRILAGLLQVSLLDRLKKMKGQMSKPQWHHQWRDDLLNKWTVIHSSCPLEGSEHLLFEAWFRSPIHPSWRESIKCKSIICHPTELVVHFVGKVWVDLFEWRRERMQNEDGLERDGLSFTSEWRVKAKCNCFQIKALLDLLSLRSIVSSLGKQSRWKFRWKGHRGPSRARTLFNAEKEPRDALSRLSAKM